MNLSHSSMRRYEQYQEHAKRVHTYILSSGKHHINLQYLPFTQHTCECLYLFGHRYAILPSIQRPTKKYTNPPVQQADNPAYETGLRGIYFLPFLPFPFQYTNPVSEFEEGSILRAPHRAILYLWTTPLVPHLCLVLFLSLAT